MKKTIMIAAALLLCGSSIKAQSEVKNTPITKSTIKLSSDLMTPEALWAMGRVGGAAASPDGKKIAYTVSYYSVQQNKSHTVIYVMDSNGKGNTMLTSSAKSESSPAWIQGGKRIAYLSSESGTSQVWSMNADGTDRRQLTNGKDDIEGFVFSPDNIGSSDTISWEHQAESIRFAQGVRPCSDRPHVSSLG